MFRCLVAGSRGIVDYEIVEKKLDHMLKNKYINGETIEIVTGLAKGPDLSGLRYAKEHNLNVAGFKAQWDLFGKGAGHIRNRDMAEYLSKDKDNAGAVVFWDGVSPGSKGMIKLLNDYGIKHIVVIVKEEF